MPRSCHDLNLWQWSLVVFVICVAAALVARVIEYEYTVRSATCGTGHLRPVLRTMESEAYAAQTLQSPRMTWASGAYASQTPSTGDSDVAAEEDRAARAEAVHRLSWTTRDGQEYLAQNTMNDVYPPGRPQV